VEEDRASERATSACQEQEAGDHFDRALEQAQRPSKSGNLHLILTKKWERLSSEIALSPA